MLYIDYTDGYMAVINSGIQLDECGCDNLVSVRLWTTDGKMSRCEQLRRENINTTCWSET